MKSLIPKYLFALIGVFLFGISSYASYEPAITKLGIEQGLSNNTVASIFQDHRGFMWFGTLEGLNRFDGYNFRIFRNRINDTNSLVYTNVQAISEDKNGNLWLGTRQGASRYSSSTDKFSTLFYLTDNGEPARKVNDVVKAIKVDKKNNVFIGTENSGLFICENGGMIGKQIPIYTEGTKSTEIGIQTIMTDENGDVWVFVQNKGLCRLDYSSMTLHLVNATVQTAYGLIKDGNDIYISSFDGVFKFSTTTNNCQIAFNIQSGLTSDNVTALTVDRKGNLWMGTYGGGINIWNKASKQMHYIKSGDSKSSLSGAVVYDICEDKEGRMWIGTLKGGINIIDPYKKRFQTIAHDPAVSNGLTGNVITSFCEAPDNTLWIGTEDEGLNIWDRTTNLFTNYHYNSNDPTSLPSNYVTDVVKDSHNNIWICTWTSGIARWLGNGHFKRYKCIHPVSGFENPVVYTLFTDKKDRLWAPTLRRGKRYGALYLYSKNTDSFEAFDTNLSDLFSLFEDKKGNFWGGNLNQLIKIDRVAKRHQVFEIGHLVRSIYEDSKGNLWLGTEGAGLILFDRTKNKITLRHTTDSGLCSNSVLNILEDNTGNLWLSTLNGLSKYNITSKTFKNYYSNDGLQSNQFNGNAAFFLKTGEFLFGGIKGFNIFQPDKVTPVNNQPNLFITNIKVNGQSIDFDDKYVSKTSRDEIEIIKVPYNEAVVAFDFAALEYSAPDKIFYAFYLEGWDRTWNYVGNTRTANYTHLSEGKYTLRIRSTNSDGEWNNKEVVLNIIILPPWYRSWWAYSLYALIFVAAVFLYQRYRVYQTKLKYEIALAKLNAEKEHAEYERQQAELVTERTEREKSEAELERERAERERKEAELAKEQAERETERVLNEKEREINEKKESLFTNISHEFRTPLTLIINPLRDLLGKKADQQSQTDSELNIIYRNARRMLSLVDQLLLFKKAESGVDKLKLSKINAFKLSNEVYLCFVQQAKANSINYVFDYDKENLEIYGDIEKLEVALYNLLSNAFKYTPKGGEIRLRIGEEQADVVIKIQDTGAGIPNETGEKLFDKFYQPDRKEALTKPGFGIGLYLVKQFIDQLKGEISYVSEERKGTTFSIKLKKGKEHFGDEVFIAETSGESAFLETLKEDRAVQEISSIKTEPGSIEEVVTEKQSLLVVEDDDQIRQYLAQLLKNKYIVYQAANGEEGLKKGQEYLPDLVISDVHMQKMNGIDLCKKIKEDPALSHIPVILLTASTSEDLRLKGVEGGADDYITKPFNNEILLARVSNLLKSRNQLQKYFYNEVTLNKNNLKISPEYKEFIERCIAIVEKNLEDEEFGVKSLASEMAMSQSNLFRKVKSVSGQSVNVFIRFIRLRKAAELLITSDSNVRETAFQVGINNVQYFREQFSKLFGTNPSEYIKKYRKAFGSPYSIKKGDQAG